MNLRQTLGLGLLGLLMLSSNSCAKPARLDRALYEPPHSVVHGADLGEWSARWWQWAYSFSRDQSPVADLSGDLAASGQERAEPVWFLAGSYSQEPVTRRCSVPKGMHIFLPLINTTMGWQGGTSEERCEKSVEGSRSKVIGAKNLRCELNGALLNKPEAHLESSNDCFMMPSKPGWLYAASGYWVMLKPLPSGQHILKFGGEYRDGFSQNITYYLTVE